MQNKKVSSTKALKNDSIKLNRSNPKRKTNEQEPLSKNFVIDDFWRRKSQRLNLPNRKRKNRGSEIRHHQQNSKSTRHRPNKTNPKRLIPLKNMEYLVSRAEIESTETFQKLEQFSKNIILRLSSKKNISIGLVVFRSTGVIPGSITGNNLKVLKDIIKTEKQNES